MELTEEKNVSQIVHNNNLSEEVNTPKHLKSPDDDKKSEDSKPEGSKSSSLPHGLKLCPPEKGGIAIANGGPGINEQLLNEKWNGLEDELKRAQRALQEKDAEVEKLRGMKEQVEGELEDLTASLFQEAHKMVSEAKSKELSSERTLTETKMKLEGLEAEVAALKALLITSTPSRPNLKGANNGTHKRTPSHNHLSYGRNNEDAIGTPPSTSPQSTSNLPELVEKMRGEVDPVIYSEFLTWRENANVSAVELESSEGFLSRLFREDILPAIQFPNSHLVTQLRNAIIQNSIWIEPLADKDKSPLPRECALLQNNRICNYRMRFSFESEKWFLITQLCRDRIAGVCELLNYLRYIQNGLVKSCNDDVYWEIVRLRKQICLAKLGLLSS